MIEIKFTGTAAAIKAEMIDYLGIKLVDRAPAPPAAAEQNADAVEVSTAQPEAAAPARRGRKPKGEPAPASEPAAEPQKPAGPVFVLDQGGTKTECTLENIEETFRETVAAVETLTDLKDLSTRNKAMITALGETNDDMAQRLLDIYQARRAELAPADAPTEAPKPAAPSGDVPSFDDVRQALINLTSVPGIGTPVGLQLIKEYGVDKAVNIPEAKRADFIAACQRLIDAKKAEG